VKRAFILALLLPLAVFAQDRTEMAGHIGSRGALLVLHNAQREDGGWRVTGEYVLLPTLVRRYLEGERSPELGVTTLKEGTTAILFGRDPIGELRGVWHGGAFKGTRYGAGGQERERFEFSEEFPSMDAYGASVRCQPEGQSTLAYAIDSGKLKSFEWRSPGCTITGLEQQAFKGGLRFAAGRCAVTLRELGDVVKIEAEDCTQFCGSEVHLEPLLVDRRGTCRLLRPEARQP
jgi:hypothetical protein